MILSCMVSAIGNMFAKLFEFKTAQIENQATTDIIEDKKDYKKATNIAEKIINLSKKYKSKMTFADKLNFSHLCEKFNKYN